MSPEVRNGISVLVLVGMASWAVGRSWQRQPVPLAKIPGSTKTERTSIERAASLVDAAFEAEWAKNTVPPAPPASELALARRVSLGLTGTVPSVEEIRAFEALPPTDRVQAWVSHLLQDRRFSDYVAERLARISVGVEDGPFILYRRHRLVSWLSDQLHQNRPYDQIVRELIAAEGIWTSKPQVNFITVTVDQNNDKEGPDEQRLAARVTRAFLGVRIDCVQCHDDQLGDRWKQSDFHKMAAFFAPAEMSLTGVRDTPDKEYRFRYLRKGEKEIVAPSVPFAPELLPSQGVLRERLARWVTHPENRAFARTLVNRTWALLFNQPLHKPIDSIPLDGPFPPGMEILASDLIEHRYDLSRLIRVIVATRVFHLDSRSSEAPAALSSSAATPASRSISASFAAYPLTRLRPEQVAGSVLQSASLETLDATSHVLKRAMRYFQEKDFVKRYGDAGEDEFDDFAGTLPQRLILMNGKMVHERTKEDLVMNAATRIGALAPDAATAVETAYLATLTRRPTPEERQHFLERSKQTGSSARFMEDLFWALINSTEYSWNH